MTQSESEIVPVNNGALQSESLPDPEPKEEAESGGESEVEDAEEPLLSQGVFKEAVGAAFVGSHIGELHIETRKTYDTRSLHPDVLSEMRDVYVRVDRNKVDKATDISIILKGRSLVVLRGDSGTGRRIAAVNAIMDLGLTPAELIVDPEALDRSLIVGHNSGFFLDLGEIEEDTVSGLANVLSSYVAKLKGASSCLIVIATASECRRLDPEDDVIVQIIGPATASVFHSHLKRATSEFTAIAWGRHPQIKKALDDATLREAVRLASMVKKIKLLDEVPTQEQVEDVLSAYYDPTDFLKTAMDDSSDNAPSKSDYTRALLIATAALEGSQAEVVFSAAAQLVELLEIEVYPGRGIFGPGTKKLLNLIDAKLSEDGVFFRRPEYSLLVVDHIWKDHLYIRKHLDQWLVGLGASSKRAAESLLHLATSQYAPDLVISAVTSWTSRREGRRRAVEVLTAAALSDKLGRIIRQKLYEWSISAPSEDVQIAVAEVCGGYLGIMFPNIALTRLRHLAGHSSTRLRGTICAAVAALGRNSQLRRLVLSEVAGWIEAGPERQITGSLAFATLANLRLEERFLLIPTSLADDELIDLLAGGLRAVIAQSE